MASSATSTNPNSSSSSAAQSRRPSPQVSSPWTLIVRGGDSVPTIAAAAADPSSPQSKPAIEPIADASPPPAAGEEKPEGNAGKKPVWKRPSNGGAAASEVGPVMGASSWPALSEAANKSSSDSLKSLGDVAPSPPPVLVSQGIANASVPSSASKPAGRANPNPTPNNSRQRSFKRNGASGSSANGTQPSVQGSLAESPSHNPSPRGQNQRNGFPSHTHGGGGADNVSQRDSYRNQNGNHHQSHGGRRNQEHGNQYWTFSRSFNGRDGNAQSQRGAPPAFVRHPPPPPVQTIPPQFMAPQPFASPLPFPPELASQYYQRMPFVAPLSPGPVFYHVQDPPLNIKLQKQIHYYFSEENLIKDTYLRRQMDDQGFVPLPVIAGFNKVAELTDSVQQIAEALQGSPVVEVQGERIRKRYSWQHWLIPQDPSSPQSVGAVASRVENLALGESSAGPNGGSSSQLQPAGAENKAVSDGQQQSPGGVPGSNRNGSDGANR
ncbi:hypothetical protein IGI04_013863 [Brassica rapa subsp. trilocularis]|uniref:HTH La-type RNA-binding domain-containing protein n=1 Tax=Brassica rapa subsp. trilocularis TaxID=1813537 RepID=A0ABQ7NDA1_BRACM|nr:hypothetical protein IGI04_013863 [Brassica rapa subsp. trilocularis]